MAAVLSVVGVFYGVAFYAGSYLALQAKDVIAPVMRKDFVPYSERKAMEARLLDERAARDAAEAPGQGPPQSDDFLLRREQQQRDLIDLLPSR